MGKQDTPGEAHSASRREIGASRAETPASIATPHETNTSGLLWEEEALRNAPTLFNSQGVLAASEAKFGAAAQYVFVESVWITPEEREERACAQTTSAGARR